MAGWRSAPAQGDRGLRRRITLASGICASRRIPSARALHSVFCACGDHYPLRLRRAPPHHRSRSDDRAPHLARSEERPARPGRALGCWSRWRGGAPLRLRGIGVSSAHHPRLRNLRFAQNSLGESLALRFLRLRRPLPPFAARNTPPRSLAPRRLETRARRRRHGRGGAMRAASAATQGPC